jgi:hypothetical protein
MPPDGTGWIEECRAAAGRGLEADATLGSVTAETCTGSPLGMQDQSIPEAGN